MSNKGDAYKQAGVDIDAANKAVDLMKKHIRSTHTADVVTDVGLFSGLFDVSFLKGYENPILVHSIDGGGTKMMIAEMMDNYTIGQCIVNHCINDILSQGARPICFMDYVASDRLEPEVMEQIVDNIATACRVSGIPLIAGETAEMPGVYHEGRHDLVGAVTGVVEKDKIIDGSKIENGDMLIGLWSNGLHTNGYSLVRKAFFETMKWEVNDYIDELGCTVGEELLRVHRCYFNSVYAALSHSNVNFHGIAHITGGGFFDNIGRLLKEGLCAEIEYKWKIPPVFRLIQEIENVSDDEMRRVFNLGIGMVLIVPFDQTNFARGRLRSMGAGDNIVIGSIRKSKKSDERNVVFTY